MKNISERELKCLKILVKYYLQYDAGVFFDTIAKETKIAKNKVRCAVRSLARKGLVEYFTGLMDDDGFLVGSGYCVTQKGVKIINQDHV